MRIKTIEKYLTEKKKVDESEDGVMGYEHPTGGRGRQGHRKGMKCPYCGKNIVLEK